MTRLMIIAGLVLAALPTTVLAKGEGWHDSYDEALKVAKAEGKDLLIDFEGSDWCHWCKVLEDEVFKHESFLEAVKKDYVLVALDYPKSAEAKARVPDPKRNQELVNQFGITGYPTVLLIDVDENVFGRTGYQRGGAENYIAHLAEIRTTGRAGLENALAIRKAAEEAKGDEKVPAFTAALDLMDTIKDEAFASALVPAVKGAIAADPNGTLGLRTRAIDLLLGAGIADDDVKVAVLAIDPKNEQGLYERFVEAGISKISSLEQLPGALALIEGLFAAGAVKDKDRAVKFRASAAFWCFKFLEQPEKAKEHATTLKAMNLENRGIQNLIKQILGE